MRDLPPSLSPTSAGKRVVLVEDGPTLTHGGMAYGAGKVRMRQAGRACSAAAAGAPVPCGRRHGCSLHQQRRPARTLTATGVRSLLQFAAEKYGAAEIVDPRPFLVGSMLWTYKKVGKRS